MIYQISGASPRGIHHGRESTICAEKEDEYCAERARERIRANGQGSFSEFKKKFCSYS